MKTILKISLIALIVLSNPINSNPELNKMRQIYFAARETAKNDNNCPASIQQLIAKPFKQLNLKEWKDAISTNLKVTAFVFKALIERFFDDNNNDSLSEHVNLFSYFSDITNGSMPEVSNFIKLLEEIKDSNKTSQIKDTLQNGMNKLYTDLSKSKNMQHRKVANNIKTDIEGMLNKKGKIALGCILVLRAKNNKK